MRLFILNYRVRNMVGDDFQLHCQTGSLITKSFNEIPFPLLDMPLRYKLNKGAKLTNCLSQGAIISPGLIVDDKIKSILDSYKLMAHKYYKIELMDELSTFNLSYYWIQLNESLFNEIDYVKSKFVEYHLAEKIGDVKINSYSDYLELRKTKGWRCSIDAKEIRLKFNSPLVDWDLFVLRPFSNEIFISKRLKDAFELNGITGIDIIDNDKVFIDLSN